MERYICIHGHFYQPPRENAWLEAVELQDSAYPYHDWNERITAECYAPNAVSRILDSESYITEIVNNYAHINFNFGPTLLSWLAIEAPEVYQAIIDADKESQQQFSGHGSALAQCYNHLIMPLANRRDKLTQVTWGIYDFEHRFKRRPEGMWLPETAVDLDTLDILAEQGIRFTILAPHQAGRVRQLDGGDWEDVSDGRIDPTRAYRVNLPSGRSLDVFFYNGPISREIAFESLLKSGDAFAQRLADAFSEERDWPQLVHIATDGETYGHHHRFADMALAFALRQIDNENMAVITNYGEYLEKHPPTHEAEIIENTSWSCVHGIERWRADCGCNAGRNPKWNQSWRAPLRAALDWLRDRVAPEYEKHLGELLANPWGARDAYIEIICDRSPENISRFLEKQAGRAFDEAEQVRALKLLELERHALLMYTSCGWFFDELSGIETVQVIQYAGRVVQLAGELFGDDIEPRFLELLEAAPSNLPEQGNGKRIYASQVKPAMVDLTKVTAHYTVSSLFEDYGDEPGIYCYRIRTEDYRTVECGRTRLAVGRLRVTSEITRESALMSFGVSHLGDHNLNAGVREYQGDEDYQTMVTETTQACNAADFPEIIRLLDKHFGISTYSLPSLFRDEQRKVLSHVLETTLAEIETAYRQLYERHYPAMRFIADMGGPVPKAFHAAAELILNIDMQRVVGSETFDADSIRGIIENARSWQVNLDIDGLSYELQKTIEGLIGGVTLDPGDPANGDRLTRLIAAVELARSLPFTTDLWRTQNIYYQMMTDAYPGLRQRAEAGDGAAGELAARFVSLGDKLSIRVS